MSGPHVVIVNQNAALEIDLRPRREAETLADAGYTVTLVGGSRSPEAVRAMTGARVNLELYPQPREGRGVVGQIREQQLAMARALLAVRRAARRAPVAAVHASSVPSALCRTQPSTGSATSPGACAARSVSLVSSYAE